MIDSAALRYGQANFENNLDTDYHDILSVGIASATTIQEKPLWAHDDQDWKRGKYNGACGSVPRRTL
jgi:hypothetical protein